MMEKDRITPAEGKTDIASLYEPEIRDLLSEAGEPAYRAGQIYKWIHEKERSRLMR